MEKNKGIEAIYPLSPLQEGILFHSLFTPHAGMYVVQMNFKLQGDLNVPALRRAWQRALDRHSILRTLFVWERREKPLQIVRTQATMPWEEHDWRGVDAAEQRRRLDEFLLADQRKSFTLTQAPLMRVTLVRMADDVHQVVWSFHHLLLDGWSIPLLLNEVMEFYNAQCAGRDLSPPRPKPYRDYILWLGQQPLSEAETFWRQTLRGFKAPTPFGVDERTYATSDENPVYEHRELLLSPQLSAELQRFTQTHGLTLNTVAAGAFALLLSRYSGEDDVVFGICTSGRPAEIPGIERMLGMFINTLPLRARVAPSELLVAWLKRLQAHQVEMRQYEYSPLVQIQGWSELPSQTPLFESLFIFENYPLITGASGNGQGVEIRDTQVLERTNYPLTIVAVPGAQLALRAIYEYSRFSETTILRLLGHFETLLRNIVARPAQTVAQLSFLSEDEQRLLLALSSGERIDVPADKCVHQLIEAQAQRAPHATAVSAGDVTLTYTELNRRANRLARYLRKLSVGPEVRVALCLDRSPEMIVAQLAVWKAGGAYVPLDPAYPQERLAFMLRDSQARVLVTQERLVGDLHAPGVRTLLLEHESADIERESAEAIENRAVPGNLAYIIYTSGSTGKPKGVLISHRNVMYSTAARMFNYTEPVRAFLLLSSFSFDSSVAGIFWTLCRGGNLVIPEEGVYQDPSHLCALIERHGISHMISLPSFYALMLEQCDMKSLSGLSHVVVAGEASTAKLVDSHRELLPHVALYNEYGPTETTVWCTVFDCLAQPLEAEVPIGRAIANTNVYVLDSRLELQPTGIAGEVYIGGQALARGYHERADLTAARFIPDPFGSEPGQRLYRTGDLARYRPDGHIEFLGRLDHQVKVRGFRIELDEIGLVLNRHPSVQEAVVVARADAGGELRLIAYVVPEGEHAPSASDLRLFLREQLPEHMVPATFSMLDALPLAPNGKIDRKALPDTVNPGLETGTPFVMPATELQRTIAAIWQEVLKVERVGMYDNFFDLGGHSLRMIQVRGKLAEALKTDIPLTDLFKYPTVNSLAESLSGDRSAPPQVESSDERIEKLRAGSNVLRQRARQRQSIR